MNVDKLLEALEDESNESLLNFTTTKLREMTREILNELHLSEEELDVLSNKLKDYKYIDENNELKYGTFIRWIRIDDPTNIVLSNTAIFCEFRETNNGTFCVCKTMRFPVRYFQISIDKTLIFQKLTDQELVLLSALDHIHT
jgi:hypothetical protein